MLAKKLASMPGAPTMSACLAGAAGALGLASGLLAGQTAAASPASIDVLGAPLDGISDSKVRVFRDVVSTGDVPLSGPCDEAEGLVCNEQSCDDVSRETSTAEEGSEQCPGPGPEFLASLELTNPGLRQPERIITESRQPAAGPEQPVGPSQATAQAADAPSVQNPRGLAAAALVSLEEAVLEEEGHEGWPQIVTVDVSEVSEADLLHSREGFARFVRGAQEAPDQLDPRFAGRIFSGESALIAVSAAPAAMPAGLAALGHEEDAITRLNPSETYTVWNGQIVRVTDPDQGGPESALLGPIDAARPAQLSDLSRRPADAAPGAASAVELGDAALASVSGGYSVDPAATGQTPSLALAPGQPALDPRPLNGDAAALAALTDSVGDAVRASAMFHGQPSPKAQTSGASQDGAVLRGQILVPAEGSARGLMVRVAGTAVETVSDAEGFFELGPFSIGSTLQLLIFDPEHRFNRRLVPVSVNGPSADVRISLARASDVLPLAQAFGRSTTYASPGFCGVIEVPVRDALAADDVQVWLADLSGRRWDLDFYSERGLPAVGGRLTRDGRLCAFNVAPGSYRLFVSTPAGRRSFGIDLTESVFESDLTFDLGPRQYVRIEGRTVIDSHLATELAGQVPNDHEGEGGADGDAVKEGLSLPFFESSAAQWLADDSGQSGLSWVNTFGYSLVTDPAYAPVEVGNSDDKGLRYVATGEELLELAEPESRSFEIVGRGAATQAAARQEALPFRLVTEDFVSGLKEKLGILPGSDGFVWYAELDSGLFVSSKGPYLARLSDPWTGQPKGTVQWLGAAEQRVLRLGGGDLDSGFYTLGVYTREGRLVWSSVVRARPGAHQVISNRK